MENYKYNGVDLTPTIFAELMIERLDGKLFKRENAIEEIKEYHTRLGGILRKKDYNSTFKKASQILREKGRGLENVSRGNWRLNYIIKETEVFEEKEKSNMEKTINYKADRAIGNGKEEVYVYYFNANKELAKMKNENIWDCKIGKSNNTIYRVFEQSGTALSEYPHIGLLIKCDDSQLMEQTIHSILKIRNRKIISAPGSEWYRTTPEEVELIYTFITNS